MTITNAFSPQCIVSRSAAFQGSVVPLSRLSDVIFLAWSQFPRPQNLEKIIFFDMANSNTIGTVQQALRLHNPPLTSPPRWPGVTIQIHPSSDAALALLGSTNIHGMALFLIQHPTILGRKTIESITLWNDLTNDEDRHDPDLWHLNGMLTIKSLAADENMDIDAPGEYD